jgi:hypothetical protein
MNKGVAGAFQPRLESPGHPLVHPETTISARAASLPMRIE